MRRSYNDVEIIKDDCGNIVGANLGWDFCAEHEWGIKGIYSAFGMKREEELGFESVKNTLVPRGLFYLPKKGSAALIYNHYASSEKDLEYLLKKELSIGNPPESIAGAWSENSFGLHAPSKYKEVPKMLYDAFKSMNGVITLSGSKNPFANSGLLLLDYTKIPGETKALARKEDDASRNEQAMYRKMEEESGVYDLLKKSGKGFFSLRIHRLDKDGKPLWWLNPYEQEKYNFGWYYTDDLKQWAESKGPIVEKRKR